MGKARIVGGGADGLYQAKIEYETERMDARIERIEELLTEMVIELLELEVARNEARDARDAAVHDRDVVIDQFNNGLATFEDIQAAQQKIYPTIKPFLDAERKLKEARLKRISLIKEKAFLEDEKPPEKEVSLWCADLTESLDPDAVVPTIEVNGDTDSIIITPQFDSRAWLGGIDGQIQPVFSSGHFGVWYNWALFPAWQKWKPTYRAGTITSITLDVCDVNLDSALSSQQSININQDEALNNVLIDYMDCNAGAFDVGDRVIVQFDEQDWTKPRVIGFESNPKPCGINDFATIPRSDDAPDGWGLPATDGSGNPINGGLGTVGGSSPWVTIRTAGYNVTRFIESVAHGNLYYKPKDINLPIISWKGPQNGYLYNASGLTTFGVGTPFQQNFGRDLYSGRKKIAVSDVGYSIIGAAIRTQGSQFRILIIVQDSNRRIRLDYADVADLNFDSQVVGWVTVDAPSNPEVDDGRYESDGTASFNKSGTKAVWMWGGDGYEWNVDSNTITRLNLSESLPDDNPAKPRATVEDVFANFVDDPCGGPDPWPTEITQIETLTQNWSSATSVQKLPVAVDYSGDSVVVLWKEAGRRQAEAFSYRSEHTHTRPEICGRGYDDAMETVTFSGDFEETVGQFFSIGDTPLTEPDFGGYTFSGGPGEMVGVSASDTEANERMRIRVSAIQNQDSFRQVERDSYIRHVDIKAGVVIATQSETESTTRDTDGMQLWTKSRAHYLQANGTKTVFWTEILGTFREEDILDENGNIEVMDPREPLIDFQIATDRYSQKVLCSILDSDGNTLLNYLTGDDPVAVTEIYGANPRFNPITIL